MAEWGCCINCHPFEQLNPRVSIQTVAAQPPGHGGSLCAYTPPSMPGRRWGLGSDPPQSSASGAACPGGAQRPKGALPSLTKRNREPPDKLDCTPAAVQVCCSRAQLRIVSVSVFPASCPHCLCPLFCLPITEYLIEQLK